MTSDNIHRCNEEWGYTLVDAKIKASLRCRKNELLGRWYSGDELIIIVPIEESLATCNRIQSQLKTNGLSATFAVVSIKNIKHISEVVKKASALVQLAKQNNNRKVVIEGD